MGSANLFQFRHSKDSAGSLEFKSLKTWAKCISSR